MALSTTSRRLLVAAGLTVAFIGMASVFSPDQSRAGSGATPRSDVATPASRAAHSNSRSNQGAAKTKSLGIFEGRAYTVEAFAGPDGPRYTVIDNSTGDELASGLTADEVRRRFPEVKVPGVRDSVDTDAGMQLMLVDPQ